MKNYTARCFQDVKGNYLTLDQSDKSITEIQAQSIEDAWDQLSERQKVDSTIPIEDRWNLHEKQ